jgi:branched-chain amino acid transport system permease protein/neutral amino acid transport system permease protein
MERAIIPDQAGRQIEAAERTMTVRPWYRSSAVALWLAVGALTVWAATAHTNQFVVGLIVGSLYALGAVGLTLIYGVTKTPHFAHGDTMMLAAYLTFFVLTGVVDGGRGASAVAPVRLDQLPGASAQLWRFSFGYGFIIALIVGAALMIPVLLGINRLVYQPLHRRGVSTAIIAVASLGVAIAVRGLMLLIWGSANQRYSTGIRETVQLPGLPRLVADQFFIFATAMALAAAIYVLLYRTKLGKAMRAMADNRDLARASGIVVADVTRWTWVVGGMLIAVAGTLLALQSQLKPELGFILLLPIFASAILGGVGSPHGAFLGGLIVGMASEVTVGVGVISPGYKISVAFVVLIFVILVRPRGLFGVKV